MLICLYILMMYGAFTLFIDLDVIITRKLVVLIQSIFSLGQTVPVSIYNFTQDWAHETIWLCPDHLCT